MLEIGELSTDRFRGIFRLTYAGDAHLLLSTKVQANPLTRPNSDGAASPYEDVSSAFPTSMPSRGILFAARPLVVPMKLRLSQVRLKAIVVLVVSKQKGITLVFKNDPLESVDVSSTFDSVAVIQKYLQQEIEGQLREMFREDLPGIIHRLSQRWLSSNSSSNKGKAAAKEPARRDADAASPQPSRVGASNGEPSERRDGKGSMSATAPSRSPTALSSPATKSRSPSRRRKAERNASPSTSPRLSHKASVGTADSAVAPRTPSKRAAATPSQGDGRRREGPTNIIPSQEKASQEADDENISFSSSAGSLGGLGSSFALDVERYDPTYGLRPDELRMSASGSKYSGLAKLTGRAMRGLGELMAPEEAKDSDASTTSNAEVSSVKTMQPVPLEEDDVEESNHPEKVDSELDDPLFAQDEGDALSISGSDDVPDHPSTDPEDSEEDEDESVDDDSPADYTRYGYPPVSADFSNTAIEDSTRRAVSMFGRSGDTSRSPRQHEISRKASSVRTRSSSIATGQSFAKAKQGGRVEYETIPAVGGGTVTRPRIYHSASTVQAPDIEDNDMATSRAAGSTAASSTAHGPTSSRTVTAHWAAAAQDDGYEGNQKGTPESGVEDGDAPFEYSTEESPSMLGHDSLVTLEPEPMDPRSRAYHAHLYRQQTGSLYRPGYGRKSSVGSTDLSSGTSRSAGVNHAYHRSTPSWDLPTSGSSTAPTSSHPSTRAVMNDENYASPSKGRSPQQQQRDNARQALSASPKARGRLPSSGSGHAMTLDASNHFMDLVNSNHTLSPFTRTLDTKGYAVRSHPVTPGGGDSSSSGPSLSGSAHPVSAGMGSGYVPARSRTGSSTPSRLGPNAGPSSAAPVKSGTMSAGGGRHRVFRLDSSARESTSQDASVGLGAPASMASPRHLTSRTQLRRGPSSSTQAGPPAGRQRSRFTPTRSHSVASMEQERGSASSGTGQSAPSSRSSGMGWAGAAPLPIASSPYGSDKQWQAQPPPSQQQQRRPALDPLRRRSAALFGEDYVSRTMGDIRE